jgi:hypothetical protein
VKPKRRGNAVRTLLRLAQKNARLLLFLDEGGQAAHILCGKDHATVSMATLAALEAQEWVGHPQALNESGIAELVLTSKGRAVAEQIEDYRHRFSQLPLWEEEPEEEATQEELFS